jgi:hypothetical protein
VLKIVLDVDFQLRVLMLMRCQLCAEDFQLSVDVDDAPAFVMMMML